MKQISVEELRTMQSSGEQVQLLDVRSPGEFLAGHIPQAVNIPMEQVESRLDDLSTTATVLVCQSGRRACMTHELISQHHSNLYVLEGGTQAWKDRQLPIVGSTGTRWSLERQVRLIAGLLVVLGVGLSLIVSPAWVYLAAFVGIGLSFAGLTNICGMALILAKLPWNQPKKGRSSSMSEVKS